MRLLLDTHALVWALGKPERLSPQARSMVEDTTNTVLVSSATAWEIATKHRLGRWPEAEILVKGYQDQIKRLGAIELAITAEHALSAGSLPGEHRDPFDRMLAAQALLEGLPIITRDPALATFRVTTIW